MYGFCMDGCRSDDDCNDGYICRCADPIGKCSRAYCETNADCAGSVCASVRYEECAISHQYACISDADECFRDEDCDVNGQLLSCELSEGKRSCVGYAECGRPFLVQGVARKASAVRRDDWSQGPTPLASPRSASVRSQLVEHWTAVGLMEHASIAAFARFTLELLSHGAPPELIVESQLALVDETRHARLAFALAGAYGGDAVGPGPLATDGALQGGDLSEVVVTTIVEGCVGETLAALEAQQAAEQCRDAVVADALRGIARDEASHASLAWKFLAWALARDPELASQVRAVFELVADTQGDPDPDTRAAAALREYGVLTALDRHELRTQVVREVIRPCASALLANVAAPKARSELSATA
jgi:hypothetical protein